MRCGLLARKIGMTHRYSETGAHIPVSVLKVENPQVVGVRTPEKHGYDAVQIGFEDAKEKHLSKPERGFFKKTGLPLKRHIVEFRVEKDMIPEEGALLNADHFVAGQSVDVSATSSGKGFAGVIKRHGFKGLRASHGVSVSHRSHGSTGHCQDPGRVFKGKKMAGHMGAKYVTTQNLQVVDTDAEAGLILVRGAVPGAKNGLVVVRDALKKKLPDNAPKPASIAGAVQKNDVQSQDEQPKQEVRQDEDQTSSKIVDAEQNKE